MVNCQQLGPEPHCQATSSVLLVISVNSKHTRSSIGAREVVAKGSKTHFRNLSVSVAFIIDLANRSGINFSHSR